MLKKQRNHKTANVTKKQRNHKTANGQNRQNHKTANTTKQRFFQILIYLDRIQQRYT